MSYRITVEEIKTVERTYNSWNKLHDKESFDNETDPQYGYVTTTELREETRELYKQEVDNLYLMAVVTAVNGTRE